MAFRMLELFVHIVCLASPACSVAVGVDARGSWNAGSAIKQTLSRILTEVGAVKHKKASRLVTVHYEALCPDSVDFFKAKSGVRDTFHSSQVDVKFTFVPYGNERKGGADWGHRECQHGERECYGNTWQTCAQAILTNATTMASHLICLMDLPKQGMPKTYWGPAAWDCGTYESCVVSQCTTALTETEKTSIHSCVENVKQNSVTCAGCKLMSSHASAAQSNKVNHVPWVIVDGKHEEDLDEGKIKLENFLTLGSASNVYSQDVTEGLHPVNLSAVDPADWIVPHARKPLMQRE